ncbi:uncharacterized protein [Clytia hemisphaerica]|uniref:uncharacterized protein n=1 Tax=Clytia hemisphaerica TaxID=252671 RepID=UPI0034D55818
MDKGQFGVVNKGTYEKKTVAVKVMESHVTQEQYLKEAKLNKLASESCENIASFLGISYTSTYAIMQEFCSFKFSIICSLQEEVSSLQKLVKTIDHNFDFKEFEHFAFKIVKDVANGLSHLHSLGIAHRDLKPANILVSNQHFHESKFGEPEWYSNPLVCKLTDFGESRSTVVHTRAMLMNETVRKSTVNDFNRGTFFYNAPEITVPSKRPQAFTQAMLEKADVWSFGMVIFSVLNADYGGIPYQENIKNALKDRPEMIVKEQVIELMRNEIPPTWSKKYAHLHNAQWRDLVKIQKSCAVHFGERPTMVEVLHSLGKQEPESDCWACFKNSSLNEIVRKIEIISLPISQNSAMEHYNEEQALAFENTGLLSDQPLENDGSNGCTYLCLKIVQNLLKEEYTGEKLEEMVAKVIWTYPAILNNFRSFSSMSPMDAYKVMVANDKNFIKMNFEYVVGSYRALTDSGKADLHEKLNSLKEDFVSVFVCLPYTVVIFRSKGKLHLIDTHSIPEKSGGTGTGVIVSSETAQDLCNWLHLRLENTEMEVNTPQSLILLKEK